MSQHGSIISVAVLMAAACGGSQAARHPAAGAGTTAPPAQPGASASSTTSGQRSHADHPVQLEPGKETRFKLHDSNTAALAHGERPSAIKPTATEAAVRFFVVRKDTKRPIQGIVIKMTAAAGAPYYTKPTDSKGYAEVLVPVGKDYRLEYLSLGRRRIAAKVRVPDEPNQNIKLTLRYKRWRPPGAGPAKSAEPHFVLNGVRFDSGKASLRSESYPRLDRVVEYMEHKPSARIRVAGYTDNVGNPRANQVLSEKRARAVRAYLIKKGIAGTRIETIGYGAAHPVASNATAAGRQQNRRIEVNEL